MRSPKSFTPRYTTASFGDPISLYLKINCLISPNIDQDAFSLFTITTLYQGIATPFFISSPHRALFYHTLPGGATSLCKRRCQVVGYILSSLKGTMGC